MLLAIPLKGQHNWWEDRKYVMLSKIKTIDYYIFFFYYLKIPKIHTALDKIEPSLAVIFLLK